MDRVNVVGCGVLGVAVIRELANKGVQIIAMAYSDEPMAHLQDGKVRLAFDRKWCQLPMVDIPRSR
jgi:UDP-N-acetylmuramoylalanine-D-glutamate ligase